MRAEYVEAVLDVAELIPPGKVLSYGDIAVLLERGGPRQVGAVMSHAGSAVPWWRVLRASGQPPVNHEARALGHYQLEGTVLRGETGGAAPSWRVDLAASRWAPDEAQLRQLDAVATRLHEATSLSDPRDGLEA